MMHDQNMNLSVDALDPNIRRLVIVLNTFPEIATVGSCGGHENPNKLQTEQGEFFVSFRLRHLNRRAWKTFAMLTAAVDFYNEYLTGDQEGKIEIRPYYGYFWDVVNQKEPFSEKNLSFFISGTGNANPEILAAFLEIDIKRFVDW